jgi:hypothetical protein
VENEMMEEIKGYELKALLFAEKYGIIDYKVENNKMTFEKSYINEGRYLHTVDLDTNKETVVQTEKPYWEK